jgi:crotonobetaine/carnitine-CoA ligase
MTPPLPPHDPQTILDVLDHQARVLGDATYIECEGEHRSYVDLRERSRLLAGGLRRLGLTAGDRIGVLADSSLAVVEVFFACARLGLVQVPLNSYLRGEFLRYQLEHSGCMAAIVDDAGRQAIRALEPAVSLDRLILIGPSTDDDIALEDLAAGEPVHADEEITSSTLAGIIYTSGTTGMPKGCMVPHGMFVRPQATHLAAGFVRPGDRLLTPSPMFHMGFLGGMLATTLLAGASLHAVRRFRASTFMQTVRESRATVIYTVGSVGSLLLAQPPTPDDRETGLRVALLPPMSPDQQVRFEERFGVPVVAENYGQTEAIVVSLADVNAPRQRGSAGRPVAYLDVAVVDERDVPVPTGEVGEIVVRPREPDAMYMGYWRDPGATLQTWRNLWHHTGDLGRQAGDGTLWLVDRKKDAIRRRGENVSSIELEAVIARHDAVEQVAVHAMASELGEDEIKACIVPRPDHALDVAELFAFFKQSLPYFAVPRYVEIMDALPVNAVGRVRKDALRERGMTATTWDFVARGMTVAHEERRGAPVSTPPGPGSIT